MGNALYVISNWFNLKKLGDKKRRLLLGMLEARKNRFVEAALEVYNRNLIRRRFASLKVQNFEALENRNRRVPLIFFSNHSSWWDGAIAFAVWRELKIDCFVMMEEKHLSRLGLFRRIGAFSVVRENPREAKRSIEYAADLLKEKPNRAVWLFPQGEILPNDARPLKFFGGVSRLIEKTGECLIVPAAMRFEFLGDFKPQAFCKIGAPELVGNREAAKRSELTGRLAADLTKTLDELKAEIADRATADYVRIV